MRLGRGNLAPALHFSPSLPLLLGFGVEALQLAASLLLGLLQLRARFRATRALVVGRLRRRRLDALPIVQLLLPLLLIDLELPRLLLLAQVGGRRLRGALLLLHVQLERILLLLPLQLVLLQSPGTRVIRAQRGSRAADYHQQPDGSNHS
jgi:hypothetical protein